MKYFILGLIIALIVGWSAYVIVRKIKRMKKGIYCDCCSGDCGKCHGKEIK